MEFIQSSSIKIELYEEQKKQISSYNKIMTSLSKSNVYGFDIFLQEQLIGFAMIDIFAPKKCFLWNYAIDKHFQNMGYGKQALKEFILFLKYNYDMEVVTTTYIEGNNIAKKMYEDIGFIVTSIVNEEDCHEVNMEYRTDIISNQNNRRS